MINYDDYMLLILQGNLKNHLSYPNMKISITMLLEKANNLIVSLRLGSI